MTALSKLKALWQKYGGSQHGPMIETCTIPERDFYRFSNELAEQAFRAGWKARHDFAQGGMPDSANLEQSWNMFKRSSLQ